MDYISTHLNIPIGARRFDTLVTVDDDDDPHQLSLDIIQCVFVIHNYSHFESEAVQIR